MSEKDPIWGYGGSKVIVTGDYWNYGKSVTTDEKEAAAGGIAPTSIFYGPFVGPLGGPI
jgi:hypothetical protein